VTWRSLDRDLAEFLRAHPRAIAKMPVKFPQPSEVARST